MTSTVLTECMRLSKDGMDVYDATFDDRGAAWETWDSCPYPGMAEVYRYIMAETEAVRIVPEKYGCHLLADIAGFVRQHAESLKAFAEEWDYDSCRIDMTEEGVWNGICTVHGIMIGRYPNEAYPWLVREWGCQA